jgi:hypothetical protein
LGVFPQGARDRIIDALTVAADGGKADIAKPMKGIASGIFEIALEYAEMHSVRFMQYSSVTIFGLFMPFRKNPHTALKCPGMKSISSRIA